MNDENYATVLNILAKDCNANAVKHGFWDDEDLLIEWIEDLRRLSQYSNNKLDTAKNKIIQLFNAEKIALEMSELAERLEVLRKDPTSQDEHCPKFTNVEVECADLIIRCLDFCGRRNLDIGSAVIAKMKYNAEREYKHGKKF